MRGGRRAAGRATRPWYARFYVTDRLRLRSGEGQLHRIEDLTASVRGGARLSLDELGEDVLDELPCSDDGLAQGATMPQTTAAVTALRGELGTDEPLELVYSFDDGTTVVLAVAGEAP